MKPCSKFLKGLFQIFFVGFFLSVNSFWKSADASSTARIGTGGEVESIAGSARAKIAPRIGDCHISIVSAQDSGKTSVKSEKIPRLSKEDCSLKSESFKSSGVDVFFRWKAH